MNALQNLANLIVATRENIWHAEHSDRYEEGYVDLSCAVCRRLSPGYFAEMEDARKTWSGV